jgi:peroxiredoxin
MFLFKTLLKRPQVSTRCFGTAVKTGDKFPPAVVALVKYEAGEGFSNEIVDINEYFENKNIVLIGFPGAFTPTCMMQQIP